MVMIAMSIMLMKIYFILADSVVSLAYKHTLLHTRLAELNKGRCVQLHCEM